MSDGPTFAQTAYHVVIAVLAVGFAQLLLGSGLAALTVYAGILAAEAYS